MISQYFNLDLHLELSAFFTTKPADCNYLRSVVACHKGRCLAVTRGRRFFYLVFPQRIDKMI